MQVSGKGSEQGQQARPARSRKSARSWGDINLTLNRLVREGVISGFKTNLSSLERTSCLAVAINTPDVAKADADSIRQRIANDLEAIVDETVVVTLGIPQAA